MCPPSTTGDYLFSELLEEPAFDFTVLSFALGLYYLFFFPGFTFL